MIYGIGTDLIEINRIKASIERYGESFLKKVFTQTEIKYCEAYGVGKYERYAVRFAAKEAFSKAVRTGIAQGVNFNEIGVENGPNGEPNIELMGETKRRFPKLRINVSLSHSQTEALAFVVAECD